MTDAQVIADALFNSGACSIGYRGDQRMEQCRIHAEAVAQALAVPPRAEPVGALSQVENFVQHAVDGKGTARTAARRILAALQAPSGEG